MGGGEEGEGRGGGGEDSPSTILFLRASALKPANTMLQDNKSKQWRILEPHNLIAIVTVMMLMVGTNAHPLQCRSPYSSTDLWTAPIRAQPNMAATASGIIGIYSTTLSPFMTPSLFSMFATWQVISRSCLHRGVNER